MREDGGLCPGRNGQGALLPPVFRRTHPRLLPEQAGEIAEIAEPHLGSHLCYREALLRQKLAGPLCPVAVQIVPEAAGKLPAEQAAEVILVVREDGGNVPGGNRLLIVLLHIGQHLTDKGLVFDGGGIRHPGGLRQMAAQDGKQQE